jgi:ribosomal-protein-alanine N-acetyltransferase
MGHQRTCNGEIVISCLRVSRLSRYNRSVFRLRDYQHGDFEELYRIDTDCFQPGIAYSRGELQSYVQRKQSFCIIAEPEPIAAVGDASEMNKGEAEATSKRTERIAGFVVVELHREGYGHVITLDVRRDFRRHRLGTLLLQAAEDRIRKLGGFMMVLETAVNNAAALAFYERHRYKILRRLPRYYAHNLDALFLTKRL